MRYVFFFGLKRGQVPRNSLAGFQGGQAYVGKDGKSYGLLVPYRHSFSPLGGANSKLTADGFNALDVMREVNAQGGGGNGCYENIHWMKIIPHPCYTICWRVCTSCLVLGVLLFR